MVNGKGVGVGFGVAVTVAVGGTDVAGSEVEVGCRLGEGGSCG
jgi:hypothetical protein